MLTDGKTSLQTSRTCRKNKSNHVKSLVLLILKLIKSLSTSDKVTFAW